MPGKWLCYSMSWRFSRDKFKLLHLNGSNMQQTKEGYLRCAACNMIQQGKRCCSWGTLYEQQSHYIKKQGIDSSSLSSSSEAEARTSGPNSLLMKTGIGVSGVTSIYNSREHSPLCLTSDTSMQKDVDKLDGIQRRATATMKGLERFMDETNLAKLNIRAWLNKD